MIVSFTGKYRFLSNFFESEITYDGILYNNAEAAFQAQKLERPSDRYIFTRLGAHEAKKMGRRVRLRSDWEEVKDHFMYGIVMTKFACNPDLKAKLLDTGDEDLEEGNTWGDKYWGTVNGIGKNILGKLLMRIRSELR